MKNSKIKNFIIYNNKKKIKQCINCNFCINFCPKFKIFKKKKKFFLKIVIFVIIVKLIVLQIVLFNFFLKFFKKQFFLLHLINP